MTRATALVCTKDRPELLGACLDSLLASLDADDELLLVEAPGTEPLGGVLGVEDARFRHLVADRAGKSHQLNVGITTARGEFILMTDDDVRVPAGWSDSMLAPFEDPTVGLVCGRVRGLSRVPGSVEPPRWPDGEAPFETWTFAHGAAMAVRRAAVLDAGGFDERLGPGTPAVGEDHDFLLRVREAGWRVMVSSSAEAVHEAWRSEEANYANALAYERGGGAVVGGAIRRGAPERWKLLHRRLQYQHRLLIDRRWFGARALAAFGIGLAYGLRSSRKAFVEREPFVSDEDA